MIIIIPLGGIGKRFSDYGYLDPKPLIKVQGKELILKLLQSLKVKKNDKVYIIYNNELSFYNFENKILEKHKNINFLRLYKNTKGPAETVYQLSKILIKENENEKTIIIDGDIFFKIDILSKIRKEKHSSIFYFISKEKKPIYSYIKIKNNYVISIAEKKIISNNANLGAYFFKNLKILNDYLKITLKINPKSYISDVYKKLINTNNKIKPFKIKNNFFEILGTPQQLRNFSIKHKSNKINIDFYFNSLFKTINKSKNVNQNFIPNEKNIKFMNFMFDSQHFVTIVCNLNSFIQRKFDKKTKKSILTLLKDNNTNYHKIEFIDKKVDFIISNNTINPLDNLDIQLGYYEDDYSSRNFNNVFVGQNITLKKSTNLRKLKNEIKYYQSIPRNIKFLFPKLLEYKKDYYKTETINGVMVNYFYLNKLLQNNTLKKILLSLDKIHNATKKIKNSKLNIYENYSLKFKQRIQYDIFKEFKKETPFFNFINKKLIKYENTRKGNISIIHGDPVFSNILIDNTDKIKFLDPRGEINYFQTIYGDIFYDYAKIYQSLTGFEQIIHQSDVNNLFYEEKKIFFENFFKSKFVDFDFNFLKILTASMYITLIPLQDHRHSRKFIELAKKLIN